MHNLHLKNIYIYWLLCTTNIQSRKNWGGYRTSKVTSYCSCWSLMIITDVMKKVYNILFISKSFNLSMSQVLQLHPLLCPYHVALSVTGSKKKEVFILSQHVAKELREGNLSVLHLPRNSDSMESQYRR